VPALTTWAWIWHTEVLRRMLVRADAALVREQRGKAVPGGERVAEVGRQQIPQPSRRTGPFSHAGEGALTLDPGHTRHWILRI
jgi:hypothetical protein